MKAVLWFCNRPVEENADNRDGTWFTAMARALAESGKIRLAIVSQAKVKDVDRRDFGDIAQWVLPYEPLGHNGLPSRQTIDTVTQIENEINPDLIHIWGIENYWGLLTGRGILSRPTLIEIQGIKHACTRVYYGALNLSEIIRCIGPVEILRPGSSFLTGRRRFEKWGQFEKEIILKHKYISTQSDWVRAHMMAINPGCTLFNTAMMLRREFFEAEPWSYQYDRGLRNPAIFTSSSYSVPYKGFHVLLRAVAILKKKYPEVVLNVAGDIMKKGIRKSGYSRWLQREARSLAIEDNIRWLGPLDAAGIIRQFHQASAVVVPSFVETYSLALAEAMLVGVPVVASYAGAMPELAEHNESALFFPPGDEMACAWQIDRILSDQTLAERLSQNARQVGLARNNPEAVLERQLGIYNKVLSRGNEY